MHFNAWGISDVGRKRDHNEDAYLVCPALGLYAVADGMGGHQGGERASRMALESLERELTGTNLDAPASTGAISAGGPPEPAPLTALRLATQRAGASIYAAAQSHPELHGMGTTLTALLLHKGRAFVAHVGDSRCYLFRDGRCAQLTEDHSWVNEQVRAGTLSREEARDSKFKHIITRSVGFEQQVLVDGYSAAVEPGDCFLLCSDGLSNVVEGDEMARLLAAHFYRKVPRLLVEVANDRGGDDNITVVLVHAANDAPREVPRDASAPPPVRALEDTQEIRIDEKRK
jgi:protein phosphatase